VEIDLYGDTLPEHEALKVTLESFLGQHHLSDAVHWHGFVASVETSIEMPM